MKSRVAPHISPVPAVVSVSLSVLLATSLWVAPALATSQSDVDAAQQAANDASASAAAAEGSLADAESAVESSAAAYEDAYAKAADAQYAVDEAQARVDDMQAQVDDMQSQVNDLQAKLSELQAQVPEQRDAADKALVTLYKLQQEGCSLLDMILGSESISDFLARLEAINRIQTTNTDKLNAMLATQSELEASEAQLQEAQSQLEQTRDALAQERDTLAAQQAEAEAQRAAAGTALTNAQATREAAQAEAEAQRQAEADAIAAANAAQEAIEMESVPADANTGSNAADGDQDSSLDRAVSSDNADWSTDKASFVAEWAPRIDAYLAGYPLEGQGTTFASAAWDYGVDPRWSPAISLVESSKGLYCFLDHNAWGWGSSSWDTWEEAIYAHVRGLSIGYGYTVTIAGAQKYCPPNWQHWYNTCVSEMDKI